MALGTLHFLVHSLQRIVCFVVIELGDAADGFPAQRRMTVFAGNVQPGTVGIPSDWLLGLHRARSLGIDLESKEKNAESR